VKIETTILFYQEIMSKLAVGYKTKVSNVKVTPLGSEMVTSSPAQKGISGGLPSQPIMKENGPSTIRTTCSRPQSRCSTPTTVLYRLRAHGKVMLMAK